MQNQVRYPITLVAVFSLLAVAGGWSPAGADQAELDQEFLDDYIPLIEAASTDDPEGPQNVIEAFEAVQRVLTFRQTALLDLSQRMPLTTFNGIETQDAFDHAVIQVLTDITGAVVTADSSSFPTEHSELFNEVMGPFPDLGRAPAPFMILGLSQFAVAAAETLWSDPRIPREAAARLALVLVEAGANLYQSVHTDAFANAQSSGTRESSVVARLRCPVEGSSYRINAMKNRVTDEGDILTIYYLQCEVCAEPALLEFPQELTSKLNKMADRQKVKKDVRATRPDKGLDP